MVKRLKANVDAETANHPDADLQKHVARIMEKHKKMFIKLAISECEETQKLYEDLVEKHKTTLKKLAD